METSEKYKKENLTLNLFFFFLKERRPPFPLRKKPERAGAAASLPFPVYFLLSLGSQEQGTTPSLSKPNRGQPPPCPLIFNKPPPTFPTRQIPLLDLTRPDAPSKGEGSLILFFFLLPHSCPLKPSLPLSTDHPFPLPSTSSHSTVSLQLLHPKPSFHLQFSAHTRQPLTSSLLLRSSLINRP